MKKLAIILVLGAAVGCSKANTSGGGGNAGSATMSKYPGTADGAKQMLTDIRTASNAKEMTLALRPQHDDYAAVFEGDAAAAAEKAYDQLWSDPKAVIAAKPEQTDLLFGSATTEDLRAGTGESNEFPGGYKRIADKLKAGVTWYRWKYVKPGETLGMAYDGLTFVNGHWAWFPKPFHALPEAK